MAHILTTIAACCAVGAFIDFYIGKDGQRRVRDWLETWWLKFSYVRWDTIGCDEARFAINAMGQLFGRRLFSLRRWLVVVIAISVAAIYIILGIITHALEIKDTPP